MSWTNDPVADFNRYDAELARRMDELPKCYECGEPIQDEHCYEFNGEYICERCLKDNHLKWTEDCA